MSILPGQNDRVGSLGFLTRSNFGVKGPSYSVSSLLSGVSYAGEGFTSDPNQTKQVLDPPKDLRQGATASVLGKDLSVALPGASGSGRQAKAYDALVDAKVWTSFVARHLADANRDKLFRQLDELHDVDEWEPGDRPVDNLSFRSFLRTIFILRPARWPSLGLTHGGNLIAIWGSSSDRVVVEFLQEDQIKWSLSHQRGENGFVRNAGVGPAAEIRELLYPYDPAHWFDNAETPR